jgi:hypothetical protein
MLVIKENALSDEFLDSMRLEFDRLFALGEDIQDTGALRRISINQKYPDLKDAVHQEIVRLFGRPVELKNSIYFTRSYQPLLIHVDSDKDKDQGATIIIPLTFDVNIKTIVWSNRSSRGNLLNIIGPLLGDKENSPILSDISKQINLDHIDTDHIHLADLLELDGFVAWSKGVAFLFDKMQLHASSNFKSLGHDHKDFIVLHTLQ